MDPHNTKSNTKYDIESGCFGAGSVFVQRNTSHWWLLSCRRRRHWKRRNYSQIWDVAANGWQWMLLAVLLYGRKYRSTVVLVVVGNSSRPRSEIDCTKQNQPLSTGGSSPSRPFFFSLFLSSVTLVALFHWKQRTFVHTYSFVPFSLPLSLSLCCYHCRYRSFFDYRLLVTDCFPNHRL